MQSTDVTPFHPTQFLGQRSFAIFVGGNTTDRWIASSKLGIPAASCNIARTREPRSFDTSLWSKLRTGTATKNRFIPPQSKSQSFDGLASPEDRSLAGLHGCAPDRNPLLSPISLIAQYCRQQLTLQSSCWGGSVWRNQTIYCNFTARAGC